MNIRADVVIIGAGPTGIACAAHLVRLGADVVVLHDPARPSFSIETLQPGSSSVVGSLLGPVLHEPHAIVTGVRSSWSDSQLIETDYLLDPSDDSWTVDRATFDADARAHASSIGVRIIDGHVRTITQESNEWHTVTADGTHIIGDFLVDATGRATSIARRLGARTVQRDNLVAMVTECHRGDDGRDGTLVEAVETGWWYATTLGDRVSVGWVTDADLLPGTSDRVAAWMQSLESTLHMRDSVQPPTAPVTVHTRRCDSTLLDLDQAEGWLAVGDAAAAWDPLSSQGLAAGIVMAGRAAEAISTGRIALRQWREDLRMLAEDTWGMQSAYYRAEQRWPDAPFWARRH